MTEPLRLFGTDGIRDLAGSGRLAPESVQRIGRALARFAARKARDGAPRIVLARDPRPSGVGLLAALAAAMGEEGADVVDAGMLPSPALAWTTACASYTLGCAISASHNGPDYNGIKPFLGDGRKCSRADEEEIETLAASAATCEVAIAEAPRVEADATDRYVRATTDLVRRDGDLAGWRLAVDLSAGAAGATASDVLAALGVQAEILHAPGARPINEACGTEHPEAWLAAVVAHGAEGGLAFDGDADRVLVADETGALLDGDDLLAILATEAQARGGVPGGAVVSTVMANLGLEEYLAGLGVTLARTKVGDRYVAERMRALGAMIGGEPAGHIVLPRADADDTLIGDGLVAGIRVLQAARRLGQPLSALRALRPRRPQVLINVRMAARKPLDAWPAFQAAWQAEAADLAEEGRFVIRYSGTEPLLRIMVEGRDAKRVRRAAEALAMVARAEA